MSSLMPLIKPGARAYSNAYFGAGSGPIFLDEVQCTSSASQLLECPSSPILSHNCLHSADAGVVCVCVCNNIISNDKQSHLS